MIIDTVLCDYGGVVADHYCEPFLSQLGEALGTSRKGARDLVSEKAPHGRAYRLDRCTKTEFWDAVRHLAPRKDFDDDHVQDLWAKTYIPNAAVLSLLAHVKEKFGVQTGVVMNEDKWRFKYIRENLALDRYFSVVVASFQVGTVKPEPEIYEKMLAMSGRSKRPDRVLYIDDRQTHVDPAIARGMQGHLYLNAGSLANFLETLDLKAP